MIALIASAAGISQSACYNAPPEQLAVWSEFLPIEEVRPHLDALAEHGSDLYFAINPNMLDETLATFLADADASNVPVRLWLQLPDRGIWLNESNAEDFAEFANDVLDWIDDRDANVAWLIFDIEPSFSFAEELSQTLAAEGVVEAVRQLETHKNEAAFEAARSIIRGMVDRIHDRGLRVMAVSLPWVVNDAADADDDLQDIFDTPFDGIDWDQVSIILYRSSLSELFGLPLSPSFVFNVAQSIRARYGPDAQIAIGTISTPGLITSAGYSDPVEIWLDVMAARSAGIRDLSVFSLDGMLISGGVAPWLSAAAGPTISLPIVDPFAGVVPFLFDVLDAVVDE